MQVNRWIMDDKSPIIIIGAARSGTKFLRDVLAHGDGLKAVPYDVNYIWRYGAEGARDDVLDPNRLTANRVAFIRRNLSKIAGAQDTDRIIEKTVSNSLRVAFVDRIFPEAQFIHLIRDGRDVAESAMRQWRAPPDAGMLWQKLRGMPIASADYALWFGANFVRGLFSARKGGRVWGPRFPDIETFASQHSLAAVCARQWVESVEAATVGLSMLPRAAERVHLVKYEDLVSDEHALRRLVSELSLRGEEKIVDAYRARLQRVEPRRWQKLPAAEQEEIMAIASDTLKKCGYEDAGI